MAGGINSVAINNAGAGIIGGEAYTISHPAYAALVAPGGALTQLSGNRIPFNERTNCQRWDQ